MFKKIILLGAFLTVSSCELFWASTFIPSKKVEVLHDSPLRGYLALTMVGLASAITTELYLSDRPVFGSCAAVVTCFCAVVAHKALVEEFKKRDSDKLNKK